MNICSETDLICAPIKVTKIMQKEFQEIQGNTFQEKIDTLNKCDCCIRHQTYRPTNWNITELSQYNKYGNTSTWELCRGNGPEGMKERYQKKIAKCSCKCRHLARFMCRQWPKEFVSS